MKATYLILPGLCFSIAGFAQKMDSAVKITPKEYSRSIALLSYKQKFFAENNVGKIYSLPLDNTPCMVANLKNQKPTPQKNNAPAIKKTWLHNQ